MATAQEDLQIFLKTNIATDEDLNLNHVQNLLAVRRTEQATLDAKVILYLNKKQTTTNNNLQLETLTANTKSVLNTCLDETKSHHATLEQLEQSLTQTTENITDFINTHGSTNSFLDNLNTLEQKLRTIENAKSYVKALLVASELR